jgi:non-ribosomal peptide synthetase component E (peptide arylation enzyme)
VVPVPDPRLGERACVAAIPEGDAPTLEDLTAFLTGRGLAKYKLPEFLVLLDDLPTNAGGKVDKARLNELVTAELGGSRERH